MVFSNIESSPGKHLLINNNTFKDKGIIGLVGGQVLLEHSEHPARHTTGLVGWPGDVAFYS